MTAGNFKTCGAVAVMTAVVIAVAALIVAVSLSLGSFWERFNALGSENKNVSYYLARSCADVAALNTFKNTGYAGNETVAVGSSTCFILPITLSSPTRTIKTTANARGSFSNLETTVDVSVLEAVSLRETAAF